MQYSKYRCLGTVFALSLLAGCEFYSPLPLEEHPRLAASLGALKTITGNSRAICSA
jgi:hypothetical protein